MRMCIYDYISLSSSNKSCGENRNTHFMFNNFFYCAVYDIMWKNTVEPGKKQKATWRMRSACWITKATNTHLEYLILISSPLQQYLHGRVSILRYMNIACLFDYAQDWNKSSEDNGFDCFCTNSPANQSVKDRTKMCHVIFTPST